MRKRYQNILAGLLFLLITGVAQAQPDFRGVQDNIADRLSEGNLLGTAIAYIYPDGRTQFITRGSLSEKRDQTINKKTIFEIGSISKTFTALMMMKMAEEGIFSLDTPIETLLPDSINVPSYEGKKITLRHLATHTSGLPRMPSNFSPANNLNPYADYTINQMYAFLDDYELKEAPESAVAYSNYGVGLLGHLLERTSGKTYEQLLEQYITQPLGMTDTGISVSERKLDRFARPYNYGNPVSYWNFPTMAGAGGIRSTIEDMSIYMKAQLGLQVSNLESAIQKTYSVQFDAGKGLTDAIGLGWFHSTQNDTIIWHNGGTGGFKSFAGFNKEDGTAVAVLSNGKDAVDDIGLHLLDKRHALKDIRATVQVGSDILKQYVGVYQIQPGFDIAISTSDGQLMAQATGQPEFKLYAESETKFFLKVVDAQIEFIQNEKGKFNKLKMYQNGRVMEGNRKEKE